MERVKGIEPSPPAWKAGVLPLNNTRIAYHHFDDLYILSHRRRFVKTFFQSFSVWRKSLLFLTGLGWFWITGLVSSKCGFVLTLFYGEKLKDVFCLAECWLFWAGTGYILQSATLYLHFSESKRWQKIFAAQTPQRKRGFLPTHLTIVGKTFQRRRNSKSSLADAPHCSMGLVSKYNLFISALTLMPCHVAVCVNCVLSSKLQFLRVITQSTGHTFAPSLPIGKKLGSNYTFMYRKTLCEV